MDQQPMWNPQQRFPRECRRNSRGQMQRILPQWNGKRTGPKFNPDELPEYVFGVGSMGDRTEEDMEYIPDLNCSVWKEEKEKKSGLLEESGRKPYSERIKICRNRKLGQRRCKHFQKIQKQFESAHKTQQNKRHQ